MNEVPLNIVELKKLDLKNPYISKNEIMELWNISDNTFRKLRNQFRENVGKGKMYPQGAILKIGGEHFNIYAWLHFVSNYDYFQDERFKKYITEFSKQTVFEFKELGVG